MRCKKANSPVALIFAPEFPTGNTNLFVKLKTNPLDSINLATCDGDFNFFTTIAGSHSFYPKPFYVSGLGSYNWRAKFNDQVLAGVEAGYKVKDKLWLITKLSILTWIGPRPVAADFIKNDGASNTSFTAPGLYELGKRWGEGFQYQNNNSLVIKLRNSYAANNFSFYLTCNKKRLSFTAFLSGFQPLTV